MLLLIFRSRSSGTRHYLLPISPEITLLWNETFVFITCYRDSVPREPKFLSLLNSKQIRFLLNALNVQFNPAILPEYRKLEWVGFYVEQLYSCG